MIIDLLVLFAIFYVVQIGIFAFGAHRAVYPHDRTLRPMVAIIVAARNEELNIGPCLESIAQLTYPKNLLDVVIVNDGSTDATESIIKKYAEKHSFIRLHNASDDTTSHLRGKTNAVAQGIEISRGELLLFTDADCIVPQHWAEETAKYYNDDGVGLVAGFTSLKSTNPFEAIQAIDWFVLFSIAAATVRLHFPVTAVGNNLSVRRKAYESVGGYKNIPFSVTEDYALFHAVTATKSWKARFPVDASTLVESLPCPSLPSLFSQKKRWFTGGADMDMKSIALFATGFVFKSLLVITFLTQGIQPVLAPLVAKLFVDFWLVRPALSTFGRLNLLLYFPFFEIYYTLYVVLFPVIVLFNRNVSWKERHLSSGPANRKAL
jgi:cellulose synthase/poly-beta-1,6-N-acetylglucosamine synthase-like glycosyltransferase